MRLVLVVLGVIIFCLPDLLTGGTIALASLYKLTHLNPTKCWIVSALHFFARLTLNVLARQFRRTD